MKPHDEEIDRVLAGLKMAEPEEGMEGRILRRLALRAEWHVTSPWRMRVAAAMGVGAVFAAVVLVVGHRQHDVIPRVEKANHATDHGGSLSAKAAPFQQAKPVAVALVVKPVIGSRVREDQPAAVRAASAEGDGQLLSESFPAPPMPLTEQEKMLLRIAHRGETQETELPTPLPLGTEVAALRAGADKFFEDPTTGENKWKQLVALQAAPN